MLSFLTKLWTNSKYRGSKTRRDEYRKAIELMHHVLTQIPVLALMTPYRHDARLSLGTRPQTPNSSPFHTHTQPSAWPWCARSWPPRVRPQTQAAGLWVLWGPLHRCTVPCDGPFAPQPWALLAPGAALELMNSGRYSENGAAWADPAVSLVANLSLGRQQMCFHNTNMCIMIYTKNLLSFLQSHHFVLQPT